MMWRPRRRAKAKEDHARIPHTPPATPPLATAVGRERNPLKRFVKILGPGLITGASDDDPSGIGMYALAGASPGYSTLWTALATFPMMTAVQFTCAKIGMVPGTGLAAAVNLVPVSTTLLIVPIALTILALQVWGSYRLIAKTFKWLTLALFAYIGSALYASPDIPLVLLRTFVPTFRLDVTFMTNLVAILGTTISPYLFFWQATNEVEEEVSVGRRSVKARQGVTDKELRYAELDVTTGMFFSNVVMYFIMLATSATLFESGKTDIRSATEAAQALRPLAGDAAYALFALGVIGAGFLAVPILTGSSAYAVAEALGWKRGLDERRRRAKLFYAMIIVPTLVGMVVNFVGINPIQALFWTAVINGLLAPPILVVIMLIGNKKKIMGARVNGTLANTVGWATTLVMFAAAVGLVVTWGQ